MPYTRFKSRREQGGGDQRQISSGQQGGLSFHGGSLVSAVLTSFTLTWAMRVL